MPVDNERRKHPSLNISPFPAKNSFEIFKFRQNLQNPEESMDAYYTGLRTLDANCEFPSTESEVLAQIIQDCYSSKIRRKICNLISL